MGLKNIYSRKDFEKVYEIFGGTHGGAGVSDGFANNAKLKDTYLGMLMNSMFKGISWLWKKSKENFIINKMIGRLINELMRGVVVYCLENNIDLKTGQVSGEAEDSEEAEVGEDEEQEQSYKTKPIKEWTIEDYDSASKEWSIEKLENEISLTKSELNDLVEKDKSNLEKSINEYKSKLLNKSLSKTDRDLFERNLKNAEDQLKEINKQIEFNKQLLPILEKNLEEKRKNADNETVKYDNDQITKPNLQPIHDACVKKYNFNIDSDELPEIVKKMNIINPTDFKQRYKPISAKLILIGDEFVMKYGTSFRKIKINDIDVKHKTVNVTTIDKMKPIENQKINVLDLRPKSFPNYLKVKKSINEYFQKYANKYNTLNDIDKQDMEKIYMAYSYLNKLTDDYEKTFGVTESYESYDFEDYDIIIESALYEFSVKDTYNKSKEIGDKEITNMKNPLRKAAEVVGTSGDVKIKPGEPKAGKISGGKAISQMAKSPTVGDILTKRDKEKFKDKSENFEIKIYDVNLAEIEKHVEAEKSSGVNVIEKVAKCVNPYNLKVIQITVTQLFEPEKTAEGASADNSKLKLKWNKKVDNVYASFYKIMDTEYINKIMESASTITTGKEFDKAGTEVNKIKDQKNSLEIADKLPLDRTENIDLQSLKKNDYYCWYNLTYTILSKKTNSNTVITPLVDMISKDTPMFQISPFFDVKDDKIVINKKMDIFKSDNTDPKVSNIVRTNVYFLLHKGQAFPHSNTKTFNVFVLNEIVSGDGTSQLFLLSNKDKVAVGAPVNFLVDNDLLTNFDVNKFKYNISSVIFSRFDKSVFDTAKAGYKVGSLYPSGTLPNTMKSTDITDILKKLSDKLQ